MKTYAYLSGIVLLLVIVGGIIVYMTSFKHIKDTNGDDPSLVTIDLVNTERASSVYTAKNRETRDTSDYSYFSSDKVSGVIVLREVRSNYIKFIVDFTEGNCEIVVKDSDNNIVHTVDLDGTSSVLLPESNGFYYVVMGAESAKITITIQSEGYTNVP